MRRARIWIFYSSIVMIFSGPIYYHFGTFRFQAFYVLMFLNFGVMLLMKKLWAPKGLIIFLGILLCSGTLGIMRGTDSTNLFLKEMLAVSAYAFYMCSFFRTIAFRLEDSFRFYAKTAYWSQILGFVLYPVLHHYGIAFYNRYSGIMQEPSMISYLCLPALYYYADCWQKKRGHGRETLVILLGVFLAQSSTAFLGLLFGCFVFLLRYRRIILLAPIICFLIALTIYETVPEFQERFDDSFRVLQTNDVEDANLSTFTLYTNLHVMLEVLKEHPVMGNGFGSHAQSFMKYIDVIDVANYQRNGYEYENFEDANSLGIRVASDLGLLGFFLMLWFIWSYRPKGKSELDVMRTAIWVYFFVKIMRSGPYFDEEQYFYCCFYALAPMVIRMRTLNHTETGEHPIALKSVHTF